jgi:hypothetical protein
VTSCTLTNDGCIICPPVFPQDAVSPSVSFENVLGWNASADSAAAVDGDLHVVFAMNQVVGAVCGFRSASSIGPAQPGLLANAFVFSTLAGVLFGQVYERGIMRADFEYTAGDQFEIRRQSGIVTYWHVMATGVRAKRYTSAVRSTGALIVSGCLFATGDAIL